VHSGPALRWLIPANAPAFPFRASSNTGIGNVGRNTSRGPGYYVTNLSLFKKIPIKERIAAELRFEAYNAFNTVNYGEPSVNINDANYGLITGSDQARQVQFGLRVSF
jgi:hypothetical protein